MLSNGEETTYDFIIIGSGLAGLQCGVILGRNGFKVLILEKNDQIGGTLQSFKHKGINYSTGLHYVGSLDEGQVLHRIFKYFNLFDGIKYHRMDELGFDIFIIGGKKYALPIGWDSYGRYLYKCFPEEIQAIDAYIKAVADVLEEQELFKLQLPAPGWGKNKPSQSVNAWDFICSLTQNEELRQVFGALNFVYAGDKEMTPWYVHALINHYFISSSFRVVGPTNQIPDKLKAEFVKAGGLILTNHQVTDLIVEADLVTGVRCGNGSIYTAKKVISNMHPGATMDLIDPRKIKRSFRNRLKEKQDTLSSFALYLKIKPNSFKYQNANFNYYPTGDVWYASSYDPEKWPEHFFMHFPVNSANPEWVDHLSVVTHMRFDEVSKWKDLDLKGRGEAYQKFKRDKAQQLLELVYTQFPEIKGLILDYTTATPLTFRDYVGSPTGSMYGTQRDYRSPLASYVGVRTKLNNLFFTGQNLNLHGVMGVSISALLTCAEFVDLPTLLNEINEHKESS